eukprot:scaffold8624_cov46-Prasinocladus_malaysianus.AAC.1
MIFCFHPSYQFTNHNQAVLIRLCPLCMNERMKGLTSDDRASSLATTTATRYVLIAGEVSNTCFAAVPTGAAAASGMLDRTVKSLGAVTRTANLALSAGSSKQGKAWREQIIS